MIKNKKGLTQDALELALSTAHILKGTRTEGLVGSNGVHCEVILVKCSLTSISDLSGIWTEGCTPTAFKTRE